MCINVIRSNTNERQVLNICKEAKLFDGVKLLIGPDVIKFCARVKQFPFTSALYGVLHKEERGYRGYACGCSKGCRSEAGS